MNSSLLDRTIGQLVAEKPSRSRVFERWGIDYCCGGKKLLDETCTAKNLDTAAVLEDIERSDAQPEPAVVDWRSKPLSELCDHIEREHHGYLREALPRLTALTEKVAQVHGARDPRLVELRDVFAAFRSEMEEHTAKEERILFPAIRALEGSDGANPFGSEIGRPIQVMLADHDSAGEALEKMSSLTNGYTPAPDDCNTHRAMLDGLSELASETHIHVHKENNILFPRAIEKASAN